MCRDLANPFVATTTGWARLDDRLKYTYENMCEEVRLVPECLALLRQALTLLREEITKADEQISELRTEAERCDNVEKEWVLNLIVPGDRERGSYRGNETGRGTRAPLRRSAAKPEEEEG